MKGNRVGLFFKGSWVQLWEGEVLPKLGCNGRA